MTRPQLRHTPHGKAVFLATVVFLIALALVLARAARKEISSPDEEMSLFPGFTVDELPAPGHKLVVTSLKSGSEAQKNGVSVGDEVLAIDNHPAGSLDAAEQIMNRKRQAMIVLRLRHNASTRDVALHYQGIRQHGA